MSDSRANKRRPEGQDHRAGEHAITDVGQLILAVLFAGAWIADLFFLRWTTFFNAHVPLAIRIPVGAVLLVVATFLAQASHRAIFGKACKQPHVVRTGVFAFVRHPMYLSEILLYLGLLVMGISLIAGGVWLATIGFLHYISRTEERLLVARFGDEYAAYMRNVPMWIPRLQRP